MSDEKQTEGNEAERGADEARPISNRLLGAVADVLDLLVEYNDPDWLRQPDNIRCDIAYARESLLSAAQHCHNPGAEFGGDTCVECGKNIRNPIHTRLTLRLRRGAESAVALEPLVSTKRGRV